MADKADIVADPSDVNESVEPAAEIDLSDDGNPWGDEQKFRASLEKAEPKTNGKDPSSKESASIYDGIPGAEQVFSDEPAEEVKPAADKPAEGAKATEETKPAEEASAGASSVAMQELNAFFPGEVISSAEDLKMIGQRFNETSQTLEAYEKLIEGNPELAAVIGAVAGGEPIEDAVAKAIPHISQPEPDKSTNPEEWANWKIKQDSLAKQRAAMQAKQAETSKKVASTKETLRKSFGAFVERNSIEKDKLSGVEKQLQPFIDGSAYERGDFFDVIHFGLNREQELEAARLEGRNQAINEMKGGKMPSIESNSKQRSMKRPLPLPNQEGQKRELDAEPLSKEDKELRHMGSVFGNDGNIDGLMGDFKF